MSRARAVALLVGTTLAACGLDVVGVPPAGVAAGPTGEAGASGTGTSSSSSGSPTEGGPGVDASDGAPAPCVASTDLQTNADHCGACGHPCRGATCSGGVCAPTIVMSGLSGPHGIALGPADVYVAEHAGGRILRVPKATPGGGGTLVFDTKQAPRALTLAEGRLYWPEQTKLRSVKTSGLEETSRPLLEGNAVIVAGEDVYFNELGLGGAIWVSPLSLADDHLVTGAASGSAGVAADADFVYWSESNNVSRRVRSFADQSETWIPGEDGPESVAIGGDRIFWAARTAIRASTRTATPAAADLYAGLGRPRSLVHDGANLYWFDTVAKTLVRGSPSGGDATKLVLARGVNQEDVSLTTAIATDDTWVYWLSSVDGTVSRVAK
ncbi:MAG: hypothetical protein U0270_40965 [Labilithrix sp.]